MNGDPYIYNAQQWLNSTYQNDSRYNVIPETGKTGWTTIYALIRALQIELGIQQTADNFGAGTIAAFNTRFPNGVQQQSDNDTTEDNVYAIIQAALFCKGYATGLSKVTRQFKDGTGNAIKQLRGHAGINNTTSTVTLNIMKALMSMDYFYAYNSTIRMQNIQVIQRYLNANYEAYIGLAPCDGVYSRGTNTAIIYALQAEEGLPTSVANGNFGPTTKNCCPTIPYQNVEKSYTGTVYNTTKILRFTKLMKMGLYVNGIGDGNFEDEIDGALVQQFQKKYALSVTGICNLGTWLSLFTSCGDTARSALACDCATILTQAKAQTLYNAGYRYVGRYLSGTVAGGASKALSIPELQIAFDAGLRIFPIQQTGATTVSYFTAAKGIADAESAYSYATALNIPKGTIIYFAVDCDPQDYEIASNIMPYFQNVSETMKNSKDNKYRIGIYGTRNVCTRVSNNGYAVSSFVSDMSTGFSGNLGYTIPDNWSFDQFSTVTVGSGIGQIEIDKDGYAGRDKGFGDFISSGGGDYNPIDYSVLIGNDTIKYQPTVMINRDGSPINVYASKVEQNDVDLDIRNNEIFPLALRYNYDGWGPLSYGVDGDIVGQIMPGDFYVRYQCRDPFWDDVPEASGFFVANGDAVHKVLFRTANGEVRFGYIQEFIGSEVEWYNILDSKRPNQEPYGYYNYDPIENKLVKVAILDQAETEYTLKRDVKYYDSPNGNYLGILQAGTILKGTGSSAGVEFPNRIFMHKKYNSSNTLEPLDTTHNRGAFVELDMENGTNGFNRVMW